jgi:hypothetical protein
MREKLFTLIRSQRVAIWQRFKQAEDRRVAERQHAILLLDRRASVELLRKIRAANPGKRLLIVSTMHLQPR